MESLYCVGTIAVIADRYDADLESWFSYTVVRCELDNTGCVNTHRFGVVSSEPTWKQVKETVMGLMG